MEPQGIDTQAIQEAIDRRRNGSMQPQGGMPQGEQPMPAPETAMSPPTGMPMGGTPPETKESSIIVKALIDRLKQYSVK